MIWRPTTAAMVERVKVRTSGINKESLMVTKEVKENPFSAKVTHFATFLTACVVAFVPNTFVSRLAAGAFLIVTLLQFAAARRKASTLGKSPEELRKMLNALAVVRTFVLLVACVVLAVSLIVPFLLRAVGLLLALSSLWSLKKNTHNELAK